MGVILIFFNVQQQTSKEEAAFEVLQKIMVLIVRPLSDIWEKQRDDPEGVSGYQNCKIKNLIFPPEMETELAQHIKDLAASYHGLSKEKCRSLTYEYAMRNRV